MRACRAKARHRVVGARAFGYFALFKVTRRKAATLSGRYRSNGYTPRLKGFKALRRNATDLSQPSFLDSDYKNGGHPAWCRDLSQHRIGEKHEVQKVKPKVRGNRCT